MIKVRVDWHSRCPGCGTQLVIDFFDESDEHQVCPWCGCECKMDRGSRYEEMKRYIEKAVREIEEKTNSTIFA